MTELKEKSSERIVHMNGRCFGHVFNTDLFFSALPLGQNRGTTSVDALFLSCLDCIGFILAIVLCFQLNISISI